MAISLQKGQKVSLVKQGGGGLRSILVGLGWDEVQQQRRGFFSSKPQDIDCDASVILCGANGKLLSNNIDETCVYFNNTSFGGGAIQHSGDDLTGGNSSGGDDEKIVIDLSRIPAQVCKMAFVVNIYDASVRKQHFGLVRNAYIRVVDRDSNTEVCRFNLSDDYNNMTGLVAGEIYRSGSEWKFNAVGQPVREASRLSSLINLYR